MNPTIAKLKIVLLFRSKIRRYLNFYELLMARLRINIVI